MSHNRKDRQLPLRGHAAVADAAQRGDIHEVRLLLLEGHDPNVPQDNGMTALHWGSFHGDVELVEKALREAVANQDVRDASGNTPLHYAVGQSPPLHALQEVTSAALEGLPIAQASLGRMYLSGIGVRQDAAAAVSWYLKSANAGNAQSQFVVGVAYDSGQGIPKNKLRARYWLRQAAAQGHETAQKTLETM